MAETSSTVPTLDLRAADGTIAIPQLGFGVWQVPADGAEQAVTAALRAGYRSIDTAAAYENEEGVGQAIAASDVSRSEVFLTTKLWNAEQGRDKTSAALDASLRKLGVEHVDLYLIHWPQPARELYVETWQALLDARAAGKIRAAGVSNFNIDHLQPLHAETGEYPALNQVELHPWLQQRELREFHAEHGIVTEAWSPLGQGGELLAEPVIGEIAQRLGKTPAQVVLRWHLQLGTVAIPKSVTPERIEQNFDVFDFELSDADLDAIAGLDQGRRLGPDPAEFNEG